MPLRRRLLHFLHHDYYAQCSIVCFSFIAIRHCFLLAMLLPFFADAIAMLLLAPCYCAQAQRKMRIASQRRCRRRRCQPPAPFCHAARRTRADEAAAPRAMRRAAAIYAAPRRCRAREETRCAAAGDAVATTDAMPFRRRYDYSDIFVIFAAFDCSIPSRFHHRLLFST